MSHSSGVGLPPILSYRFRSLSTSQHHYCVLQVSFSQCVPAKPISSFPFFLVCSCNSTHLHRIFVLTLPLRRLSQCNDSDSLQSHACQLRCFLRGLDGIHLSLNHNLRPPSSLDCPWLNRVLKNPFYVDNCVKISSTSQAPAQYFTWHLSPSFSPSCAIRCSRPRRRRQSTMSWLS